MWLYGLQSNCFAAIMPQPPCGYYIICGGEGKEGENEKFVKKFDKSKRVE